MPSKEKARKEKKPVDKTYPIFHAFIEGTDRGDDRARGGSGGS